MTKIICEKGHFYNGDKYDSCPTCQMNGGIVTGNFSSEQPVMSQKQSAKSVTPSESKGAKSEPDNTEKKGWLKKLLRGDDHKTQEMDTDFNVPDTSTVEMPNEEETSTAPLVQEYASSTYERDMIQAKAVSGVTVSLDQEDLIPVSQPSVQQLQSVQPVQSVDTQPIQSSTQPVQQLSSFVAQVSSVAQENMGSKTVAFYGKDEEPVTGWLVNVNGTEQGISYPLKSGQNFIGRAINMDVPLVKEPSVSRNKHAVIIFEPKKKIFLLQPGDSAGLTYVNDDLVMSFVQLKAYDKIQLGDCLLLFIPLCGSEFSWDEYIG